jgi:hypothetical protein
MPTIRNFALSFLVACGVALVPGIAQAAQQTFELRIDHGRVPENMRLIRVLQDDVVTLRWTVDRPVTLHLHGYDIEKHVDPGTVGVMSFEARATGRFPIEVHGAGGKGGSEEPLVYVEVYPR